MKKDQRSRKVKMTFEPSRLKEEFLAKAYEAVVPIISKPITDRDQNLSEEVEDDAKQDERPH